MSVLVVVNSFTMLIFLKLYYRQHECFKANLCLDASAFL